MDQNPSPKSFPYTPAPPPPLQKVHWNYVDCVRWLAGGLVLSKSVDDRIVLWAPEASTEAHRRQGHVRHLQVRAVLCCSSRREGGVSQCFIASISPPPASLSSSTGPPAGGLLRPVVCALCA